MSLLKGQNAVITGATRGIGRGLAVACGEQGANVFITGRTATGPNSLEHVAELVRAAGGNCEYFVVDHADDEQVAQLFEDLQSKLASNGSTLDIFVNNAYAAVSFIAESREIPFWKKSAENPAVPNVNSDPGKVWDLVNGVGLRNNYVCAVRALRVMEKQGSGTLINITSWASLVSLFDVAYSVGKEALDRLSAECALAAPGHVTCFSLCPGFVSTPDLVSVARAQQEQLNAEGSDPDGGLPLWNAETPLFVGRVLVAIVSEKGKKLLPTIHGKTVLAAEAAEILDVYDENDFRCLSFRSMRFNLMVLVPFLRTSSFRKLIPRTLYAPWPLVRWLKGAKKYWN